MGAKKRKGKSKLASAPIRPEAPQRETPEEAKTAGFPAWLDHPVLQLAGRGRVLIVSALALLLFLGAVTPFVYFQGGDNAEYIMLARALVDGQGYTSVYTNPPEPHTKYPFLFPLMIAGIFWFFGGKILLVKILIAILAAVMVGATYRLWEEREEPWIALLTAVLVATVPFTLSYSVRVLSEIPFAAFATLSLLFCERSLKQDSLKNPSLVLCAVFLILAFFTRSVGIALAPALIGAVLLAPPLREQWKRNLLKGVVMTLPFLLAGGGWFLRGYLATHGHGKNYLSEFFIKDPYDLNSPLIGWTDLVSRVQSNGRYYLEQLAITLWPFSSSLDRNHMIMAGSLILLLALLGFGAVIRRRRGAPELFTLSYAALLLIWGFYENRFLIPLYPLLIYYGLKGIQVLLTGAAWAMPLLRLRNRMFSPAALGVLALFLLVSNLSADLPLLKKMAQVRRVQGFELRPGFQIIATNEGMNRILHLALYLRAHAEPEAVIFARKPTLVALVSERKTVGGPFVDDPAGFIAELEKNQVTYIVFDEVYKEIQKYFVPAMRSYPQRFQVVYQIPNTQSQVYKLLPKENPY